MPKSLKYITKIEQLKAVVLEGKLSYVTSDDPDDMGGWRVIQTSGGKGFPDTSDDLGEWLEKFADKYVTLSIQTHERNEAHLLPPDDPGSEAVPQPPAD